VEVPKVKERSGSRTTRSAGKSSLKAPAAPPVTAKPATTRPPRKAATKVAATSPKPTPRRATKAAGKAGGRTGDESRRRTTSKKQGKATAKGARKAAPAARKGAKALPVGKIKPEPVRGVKIRKLNPQEKCGPDTSVLQLFRVDESLGRELTTHLVFFDRHGWYCEHGRTCRAVADVQKKGKRMVVGL